VDVVQPAKLLLALGIEITAFTSQVGHIAMTQNFETADLSLIESNIVRCPETETAEKMIAYIKELKEEGDSIGGIISCIIKGVPVGLGEPIFDKLQARLAQAMLSINATHGFDYGRGFEGVSMKGSQMNDSFNQQFGWRTRWNKQWTGYLFPSIIQTCSYNFKKTRYAGHSPKRSGTASFWSTRSLRFATSGAYCRSNGCFDAD